MDFPKSIINIDEHRNKIYELLKDEKTVIFIDTNIIALLYQLNKKSREEFFTWVSRCKEKNRFKVPSWVIHEYSSRFTKNQISEYLSSLKTLSKITDKYDNICKFLGMYIDDNIINSNNSKAKYSNVDELKNDIGKVADILEKLSKLSFLKKHKADFIHEIHTEIINNFENCQLETDLDSIMKEIESIHNIRYEHKIPPGYQDSKKEFNNLGDLILWKEILLYSKNEDIRKVVFLTNDAKKDWVYAPMKIIDNGKTKNNELNYKIIDNRLVYEFYKYTGSKEIEIVDFEELIKIIINKESDIFSELGRALQTINEPKSSRKSNNEIEPQEDTNEVATISNVEENSSTKNINSNKFDLDTETALKDKYVDLSDDSNLLVKTIIGLKSYNWYEQNAILDDFLSVIRNKKYEFIQNKEEQSRLFVIGRNIYQALCGNSREAYDLVVNRLQHFIQHTAEYEVNLLIAGMFYEVYFDSEGNFREDGLKSLYLDELLKIEGDPKLKNTKNFIKDKLSDFSLPYVPFSDEKIDITLEYEYRIPKTNFPFEEDRNILVSIKIGDKEFLTDNEDMMMSNYQNMDYYAGINKLKTIFENICGIPKGKIDNLIENGKNEESKGIFLENKKIKKLE